MRAALKFWSGTCTLQHLGLYVDNANVIALARESGAESSQPLKRSLDRKEMFFVKEVVASQNFEFFGMVLNFESSSPHRSSLLALVVCTHS